MELSGRGFHPPALVDPGDFVSRVDLAGINSVSMNIEAIPIKVVIY